MDVINAPRQLLHAQYRLLRLPVTVVEALREHASAQPAHTRGEQARQAFLDGYVGAAKEWAGFVLGNNDLIAEGQLQRTKAEEQRHAAAQELVAERREEAAKEKTARRDLSVAAGEAVAEIAEVAEKQQISKEKTLARSEVARQAKAKEAGAQQLASARKAGIDREAERARRERNAEVGTALSQEAMAIEAQNDADRLERVRKSL